jgi:hypothetical protein
VRNEVPAFAVIDSRPALRIAGTSPIQPTQRWRIPMRTRVTKRRSRGWWWSFVPAGTRCVCAGGCHCAGMRPYVLRLENESEFFRDVM